MNPINPPPNPAPEKDLPEEMEFVALAPGLVSGILTAFAFGMGGFFLISSKDGSMGAVLFLLLPFATGFATAVVVKGRLITAASLIIGLLLCTVILLLTGLEGFVCVLMSAPLIAIGLTLGALLGVVVRRQFIEKSPRPYTLKLLLLLVLPLFLMGANSMEEPSRRMPRAETFTSVLALDATPDKVWNTIKSMDRVNAHKGFLMTIGLPVPVSCSVDREAVGGKRTCYFEKGYIEELITEWDPPRSMKLQITAWDVPGRPWLDFKEASYEFHVENGKTIMTRNTTIASRLMPAWYWRHCEEIGVKTEHDYLFEAVKHRAEGGSR